MVMMMMMMMTMMRLASDATGVRVLGGCVNYGTASIVAVLPWLLRRKLVVVLAVAAAAEVGGCSCRGCGGGSWWLFLPWLRRRKYVGEGRDTRLDAATTAGCRRATLAAGRRRGGRGRGVGEGGVL